MLFEDNIFVLLNVFILYIFLKQFFWGYFYCLYPMISYYKQYASHITLIMNEGRMDL